MSLGFLCINHKVWFESNSQAAIKSCMQSCGVGWGLYKEEKYHDALPFVGSAFEIATILLGDRTRADFNSMQWFLHTLEGLVHTLKKLDRIDVCQHVYQVAIDRLKRECKENPVMKTAIDLQLNRIEHELYLLTVVKKPYVERVFSHTKQQQYAVLH